MQGTTASARATWTQRPWRQARLRASSAPSPLSSSGTRSCCPPARRAALALPSSQVLLAGHLSVLPCVTALLDLLASPPAAQAAWRRRGRSRTGDEGVLRRYERRYIERWLAGGRNLCPSTGTVLTLPATLVPNVALRKSIEVWAEKHARWMLVRQPSTSQRQLHSACSQQQGLAQLPSMIRSLTNCSSSQASDRAPAHSLHKANAVSPHRQVCAVPHLCCACMQGQDGKVKAIPEDEDFARPGTAGQEAADLTLAVHLQQEELLTGNQLSPMSQSSGWATQMLPSSDNRDQPPPLYSLPGALHTVHAAV